jgi:hypothetical protein
LPRRGFPVVAGQIISWRQRKPHITALLEDHVLKITYI